MQFDIILRAAMATNALRSFFLSGRAADQLVAIEFAAARRALLNVRIADDPIAQANLAAGHLQTTEETLVHIVENQRFYDTASFIRHLRIERAERLVRHARCMMALCYAFTGDHAMCKDSLERAPEKPIAIMSGAEEGAGIALMFLNGVTSAVFLEFIFMAATHREEEPYEISNEEISQLRRALLSRC